MTPHSLSVVQDTTVVELARDGLASFSAWAMGGAAVALVALLVVLLLVLVELRRLAASWTDFLAATGTRSQSLVDHASSAARNIDHITRTVRGEVDRLGASVGGLAKGIEYGSTELQRRLKDLLALVDVAQSEAEDAVLEVASRVRTMRTSAAGLFRLAQLGQSGRTPPAAEPPGQGPAPPADAAAAEPSGQEPAVASDAAEAATEDEDEEVGGAPEGGRTQK